VEDIRSVAMATTGAAQHQHVSRWLPSAVVASRIHRFQGTKYTRESSNQVCRLIISTVVVIAIAKRRAV